MHLLKLRTPNIHQWILKFESNEIDIKLGFIKV